MSGEKLLPFPSTPELSTLTLVVAPVWRSWTKTSELLLVSPATTLVAKEWKATKRPSLLMVGIELASLASTPALSTLTRSVIPGKALAPVRKTIAVSRPINAEAGINQSRRVFMAVRFRRDGSPGRTKASRDRTSAPQTHGAWARSDNCPVGLLAFVIGNASLLSSQVQGR